jgi:hypothetical protein
MGYRLMTPAPSLSTFLFILFLRISTTILEHISQLNADSYLNSDFLVLGKNLNCTEKASKKRFRYVL